MSEENHESNNHQEHQDEETSHVIHIVITVLVVCAIIAFCTGVLVKTGRVSVPGRISALIPGQQSAEPATIPATTEAAPRIVPESERAIPEGAQKIVYPKFLVDSASEDTQDSGKNAQEYVKTVESSKLTAYANEDGTVSVYADPARMQTYFETIKTELAAQISSAQRDTDLSVSVSADNKLVVLSAGSNTAAQQLVAASSHIAACAAVLQLSETQGQNFSLSVDMLNGATGQIMEHYDQGTYASWTSKLSWLSRGGGAPTQGEWHWKLPESSKNTVPATTSETPSLFAAH